MQDENSQDPFIEQARSLINSAVDSFNDEINNNYSFKNYSVIKNSLRSTVLRINLEEEKSFILKIIKENKTCGFNDYAGLKFLSELKTDLAPQFYYGKPEKNFFIFEDVKTNLNFESILKTNVKENIKKYFRELADRTAELNIRTYNKEQEFHKIRDKLPKSDEYGLIAEDKNFYNSIKSIKKWFEIFNIKVCSEFYQQIEIIRNKYINNDRFVSFTNGDFAPSNNLIKEGIILIDFEYCGYRPMFYDFLVWETLCPIEEQIFKEAKILYLNKISRFLNMGFEEIEKEYDYIFLWRALVMLSWFDPMLLEKDNIWAERWTRREAMVSLLKRVSDRNNKYSDIDNLIKPLSELFKLLSEKFNYEEDNYYPKWS